MPEAKKSAFETLLEKLPIPTVVSSAETGLIVWANARDLNVIGATSPQQIIGRNLLEFIAPDQQAIALRDLEAVTRGAAPPPVVYHLNRIGGGIVDVLISSVPILFRGEPAMLSVVVDVSERERELRRSLEAEQRYRALIEASPDGVCVVDRDGIVVFANPALATALGHESAGDIEGTSMYDHISAPEQQPVREARRKVLRTRRPHAAAPVTLICRDGSPLATTAASSYVTWNGEPATQTLMRDLAHQGT